MTEMTESPQDRLTDWFRHWRIPLRRFLSSRRNHSSADLDDIAQEVFLRMLRYDRSDLIANPQAYLFKMAANVSVEWATRACRRQPHSRAWLDSLTSDAGPETHFEREATDNSVQRAIESLPLRARTIVRLYYEEGLAHEVIAQRLEITRRVVKRDLLNAYSALRDQLASDQQGLDFRHDRTAPGKLP